MTDYLNLHANGPYDPDVYSATSPFRYVLRKKNLARAPLVSQRSSGYDVQAVGRGETGSPCPLWVVRKPDGRGHFDADCFAMPKFDAIDETWKCVFWTTNDNGGGLGLHQSRL